MYARHLCTIPLLAACAAPSHPVEAHLVGASVHTREASVASAVGAVSTPLTDSAWGDIAIVPDVNGDGRAEVLNVDEATGDLLVYRGEAAVLSGAVTKRIALGLTAGAQVTGAGDVDGDGYNDVIVGDHAFGGDLGRVQILRGSPRGLANRPSVVWMGRAAGEQLGAEVAGLGDVDGDGYDDVAFYVPGNDVVRVHYGGAHAVMGRFTPIPAPWHAGSGRWTGYPEAFTGDGLAAAGDVNGDGYADLTVSYPLWNAEDGGFSLFLGAAGGIATAGTLVTYPYPGSYSTWCDGPPYMGSALVGDVDFDGDGYADLAASAPYDICDGYVYVWYGSAAGYTTAEWAELYGYYAGESQLGLTLGAGDFDADGLGDLVLGGTVASYAEGDFPRSNGVDEPLTEPTRITGTDAYYGRGAYTYTEVAGGGDVNGDGFDDVVVSVASTETDRAVTVHYGGS